MQETVNTNIENLPLLLRWRELRPVLTTAHSWSCVSESTFTSAAFHSMNLAHP